MTAKRRRDIIEAVCLLALGCGTGLACGIGWGIIVVAGLILVASVTGTLRSRG